MLKYDDLHLVLLFQLVLISMFLYASYEVFYGYLLQTDQDKVCANDLLKSVTSCRF